MSNPRNYPSAGHVLSLNLNRRNLTSGQKAAVALDFLPELEKEAKERQKMGKQKVADPGQAMAGNKGSLSQKIDEAGKGKSAKKLAERFDTNRQYRAVLN